MKAIRSGDSYLIQRVRLERNRPTLVSWRVVLPLGVILLSGNSNGSRRSSLPITNRGSGCGTSQRSHLFRLPRSLELMFRRYFATVTLGKCPA
jgi:hypothetical protein